MDCNFVTEEGRFNFRVGAVIVHNGKLLGMRDYGDVGHSNYLPGGRVHLNETMEEALRRELWEELGVAARVIRPLWLRESFDGRDKPPYHGLEMYFLTELDWDALPSLSGVFARRDTDGEEHVFRWLEPGGSPDYIHPEFVQRSFPELPEQLTLICDVDHRTDVPPCDFNAEH